MKNGNVVANKTYGQFVYMLYEKKEFLHTTYRQLLHIFMEENFMYIQNIDKMSICCMYIKFFPYNIWKSCPYVVWKKTLCTYNI